MSGAREGHCETRWWTDGALCPPATRKRQVDRLIRGQAKRGAALGADARGAADEFSFDGGGQQAVAAGVAQDVAQVVGIERGDGGAGGLRNGARDQQAASACPAVSNPDSFADRIQRSEHGKGWPAMVEVKPAMTIGRMIAIGRLLWLQRLIGAATIVILLACLNCGHSSARLRISNESSVVIRQMSGEYPNEVIQFGDVGPSMLTPYHAVSRGVGRYASFSFIIDGNRVEQRVADFVGWKPIEGAAFTYRVRVEPGRSGPRLNLIEVSRDR